MSRWWKRMLFPAGYFFLPLFYCHPGIMEIFPGPPCSRPAVYAARRNEAQTARNWHEWRAAWGCVGRAQRRLYVVSLETLTEAIFGPITMHVSLISLSLSLSLFFSLSIPPLLFQILWTYTFMYIYIYNNIYV